MSLEYGKYCVNSLTTDIGSAGAPDPVIAPASFFDYQPSFINPQKVEWSLPCPSF